MRSGRSNAGDLCEATVTQSATAVTEGRNLRVSLVPLPGWYLVVTNPMGSLEKNLHDLVLPGNLRFVCMRNHTLHLGANPFPRSKSG